jgi:hypothetical protein
VGKKMAELGVSVDSLRAIAVGMKSSSDGSPASVVAAEGSFDREKVSAELAKLNGGEKLTVGGAGLLRQAHAHDHGDRGRRPRDERRQGSGRARHGGAASGETVANNEAVQAALGSVDGGAPTLGRCRGQRAGAGHGRGGGRRAWSPSTSPQGTRSRSAST